MKKIPTLFEREFKGHKIVKINPALSSPDLQWVIDGEGTATEKIDGACCAIINMEFYKRYDAKKGKKPPEYAIPCCEPDPVTGHWPHWMPVGNDPSDKWFISALKATEPPICDGTYEAIGPHFQGNPYHLEKDVLEKHGIRILDDVPRTFEGIRDYLQTHEIEGIVFWKDGEPKCKIKRSDFGFQWPV